MIFQRKNDTIKKIENILKEISKNFEKNVQVSFNEKEENSFFRKNLRNNKCFISIGMKINKEKDFDNICVVKVIDIFHEYKHFLQYINKDNIEIKTSIELGNVCPSIKKIKYSMLPQELDAEIYAILEAKVYFEEKHPSIDFEKHLLEYVNNVERWYGPKPLKGDRPTFTSFEEIVVYLYENLEISYNYPVFIEYNGFDNKVESVRVANLDSGAEQFYLIAKDLCNKKLVSEPILDATKELMDYYCKNKDRKISNKKDTKCFTNKMSKDTKCFENEVNKEETVDDILLSTNDVPSLKPSISIVDTSKNINLLDIDK